MIANEIRKSFLDFFKSKNHHIVPSAPVVPQDDPTLLFINAGMNPFKDIFLGNRQIQYPRIADSQKCIRVSGKHNDLEQVGRDTYHHTFFEMLGNWSFGDYFKAEAIEWAWQLLTETWKLPKERLWATIFAGDSKDKVPADEEAAAEWLKRTDIAPERILQFGKKDNFWEMGDTGPCGPCSEIHFDRGPDYCDKTDSDHRCDVNGSCGRYIELWNLVFIQYNRDEKNRLHPLPAKHVDTGAGLERVVAVLQNKKSNYDTDIFAPIIEEIATMTGHGYKEGEIGVAFRVLCDHVRALAFAVADGAIPGNEGRGYVLRRILRRAARFGRVLSMHEPFIFKLVMPLVQSMGDAYPELKIRREYIEKVIRAEEESFGRTLDRGIEIFEEKAQAAIAMGKGLFPGRDAFLLHDTYGFPLDLTQLMAQEKNLSVDVKAFEKEMAGQRERSNRRRDAEYRALDLTSIKGSSSKFVGYERDEMHTTVLHYDAQRIILKETPFYAESGGQVGDTGTIENEHFKFKVDTTRYVGEHIVHFGKLASGTPPKVNDRVLAKIDVDKRRATERNHTVTHLIHRALRTLLGEHVHQAGSLVAPDYMRFDFTHFEKMSSEQIRKIERMVNDTILENRMVSWQYLPLDKAKALGAMALFGEKYEEQVRVVEVEDFSRELCGGTHVRQTGEIGPFVIINESAVAAGIRRIECLTGLAALDYLSDKARLVQDSSELLGCSAAELSQRIRKLYQERKELEGELRKIKRVGSRDLVQDILKTVTKIDGINIATAKVDVGSVDELKQYGDLIRDGLKSGVGVLAAVLGDKVNFICVVTKDLIETKKLQAGDIVKKVAGFAGGSGGGSAHMALAGAKDVDKVRDALSHVAEIVRQSVR
ncbi:alanine--tRNA ligase [candidate division KSB1 bacterium]|nr:alanine--tRNA ligase [candidate division KSB1 bacterium]